MPSGRPVFNVWLKAWAELFKAGLVSARFEFRFKSSKSILVLFVFVHKLMIGSSKNYREKYPR